MPENDEHDPLDSWLDEQVRPLMPPSGTFELIARRARRRKVRRLVISVASAVAVAAAVAVAVPGVTALHLTTPGETGNAVAEGRATSSAGGKLGGGTQGVTGTGTQSATPTPPASAPTSAPASPPASTPVPASTGGPYAGPVPANFAPTSVTFTSASNAWVIGQAGTPGDCYSGKICTSVAWTSDDGATWHGEHAPVTGAPSGPTGVSGIRFLDGVNGWAFGPELWVTHDSGNSWQQISTDGQRVTGLETVDGRAYAVFATCSGTSSSGFAADCTSYTLMTSTATSDDWAPVGAATSDIPGEGGTSSAMIQLTGTNGYLIAPDGTVYSGPIGGTWSNVGTAPCGAGSPQASGLPKYGMIAVSSPGTVAVACYSGSVRTASPWVSISTDGGSTWSLYSASAWSGTSVAESSMTSLTAAPNGTLVLGTTSGIYVLPSGSSVWKAAVSSGSPAGGFSYVGMTSDTQGVALPADSSLGEIWLTTDGGLTWTPSRVTG